MSGHQPLNLIRLFDFYLTMMFLISFLRRWDVYLNAARIMISVRGRWPRLIQRLGEHKSILLNKSFFRPALVAFALALLQLVASRLVWPYATLAVRELLEPWWHLPTVVVPLVPMVFVDAYFIIRVGRFDHDETVRYFDMAERWLGWKRPLVRVATLGVVDPKRVVDSELKRSLAEYQSTLSSSLWWVIVQTGLRLTFGLTLWTVWAVRET
jgi:hypothetical protein